MNKCLDCKKIITKEALRCKSCRQKGTLNSRFGKTMSRKQKIEIRKRQLGKKRPTHSKYMQGKGNSNYKKGKTLVRVYCVDCNKKLDKLAFYNGSKRCKKCDRKYAILIGRFAGDKNAMNGKNRKKEIVKHHVDLNHENNKKYNILKITSSKHSSLHHRAYDYLVKIGKIRQYIKWFFKQDFKKRRTK